MCNLYNISTNREAITKLTRALDRAGWNEPSRDVYPGMLAPIVRVGADGVREMVMATWGMPSPPAYVKNYDPGVTNIRNTLSPHWRRWLGPANRGAWCPSRPSQSRTRPLPDGMLTIVEPPQDRSSV
jgi:putative SOS response-associated peptidase YedK